MLKVNQQEINLGTTYYGRPTKFKYSITNEGEKRIVINRLVKGCNACTEASIQRTHLDAGESTDIDVIFTPGSTGMAIKSISVEYTVGGDKQEALPLKFRANVSA